jgi:hypothetical protein
MNTHLFAPVIFDLAASCAGTATIHHRVSRRPQALEEVTPAHFIT